MQNAQGMLASLQVCSPRWDEGIEVDSFPRLLPVTTISQPQNLPSFYLTHTPSAPPTLWKGARTAVLRGGWWVDPGRLEPGEQVENVPWPPLWGWFPHTAE